LLSECNSFARGAFRKAGAFQIGREFEEIGEQAVEYAI